MSTPLCQCPLSLNGARTPLPVSLQGCCHRGKCCRCRSKLSDSEAEVRGNDEFSSWDSTSDSDSEDADGEDAAAVHESVTFQSIMLGSSAEVRPSFVLPSFRCCCCCCCCCGVFPPRTNLNNNTTQAPPSDEADSATNPLASMEEFPELSNPLDPSRHPHRSSSTSLRGLSRSPSPASRPRSPSPAAAAVEDTSGTMGAAVSLGVNRGRRWLRPPGTVSHAPALTPVNPRSLSPEEPYGSLALRKGTFNMSEGNVENLVHLPSEERPREQSVRNIAPLPPIPRGEEHPMFSSDSYSNSLQMDLPSGPPRHTVQIPGFDDGKQQTRDH